MVCGKLNDCVNGQRSSPTVTTIWPSLSRRHLSSRVSSPASRTDYCISRCLATWAVSSLPCGIRQRLRGYRHRVPTVLYRW
ncbi:hypothetical protein VTK26DRAFT_820 [Humicola hyalothermophila]